MQYTYYNHIMHIDITRTSYYFTKRTYFFFFTIIYVNLSHLQVHVTLQNDLLHDNYPR